MLTTSPRTLDRRLRTRKTQLRRRLCGRTKPGTLLKHHIPIKTEHWNVTAPGFAEIDLVSHSANSADGEFLHSLNLTDIHTAWVETGAVLGRGQTAVLHALEEMAEALSFPLCGLVSDNGSEFINHHLLRYCQKHGIQFTRGRPCKKGDNLVTRVPRPQPTAAGNAPQRPPRGGAPGQKVHHRPAPGNPVRVDGTHLPTTRRLGS